jgi:hypothetical protein
VRREFAKAFLIELNPALMPVAFTFVFKAPLLHRGYLMLERREPFSQLHDLILMAQHIGRIRFEVVAEFFGRGFTLGNVGLKDIELVSGKLRVQVLQLRRDLFVAPRLSGLPLKRPNLAFDLANQVSHPQKILLRALELPQSFFPL